MGIKPECGRGYWLRHSAPREHILLHVNIYILSFSRRFYPKRLTHVRLTMYTHFTFLHGWHTAHQEQLGVQCLAQGCFDSGNRTSNLLITKRLLYLSTCTTVATG